MMLLPVAHGSIMALLGGGETSFILSLCFSVFISSVSWCFSSRTFFRASYASVKSFRSSLVAASFNLSSSPIVSSSYPICDWVSSLLPRSWFISSSCSSIIWAQVSWWRSRYSFSRCSVLAWCWLT